jgi:nucleoside-diphosphate-sugar epimerase
MKKILVTGAGGCIGTKLVERLKSEGYWVRGVDLHYPYFSDSPADEFLVMDLRHEQACRRACQGIDEVYHLAADMGGMGFIESQTCELLHNSTMINIRMVKAAAKAKVKRYFFSSTVCVYRDMLPGEPQIDEEAVYPAMPDSEYGWEKLYAERVIATFGREYGFDVRIARFQNTYGPGSDFATNRAKAPAQLCWKVAKAEEYIEVWGDGTAVRNFTYIDDCIDGIRTYMDSDETRPVNIGSDEYVTVNELAETIIDVSGKDLDIKHVDGPIGVHSRNFSNERIKALGWTPKHSLRQGIGNTYTWVQEELSKV